MQRSTRPQKPLLFMWLLVYNESKVQCVHSKLQSVQCVHRRESSAFSIDDRLRIAINTVMNTMQNMEDLDVQCGMSAGCNNVIDWRNSAKTAAFSCLWNNHSAAVKTDSDP